jgi:hypothetical protein
MRKYPLRALGASHEPAHVAELPVAATFRTNCVSEDKSRAMATASLNSTIAWTGRSADTATPTSDEYSNRARPRALDTSMRSARPKEAHGLYQMVN